MWVEAPVVVIFNRVLASVAEDSASLGVGPLVEQVPVQVVLCRN